MAARVQSTKRAAQVRLQGRHRPRLAACRRKIQDRLLGNDVCGPRLVETARLYQDIAAARQPSRPALDTNRQRFDTGQRRVILPARDLHRDRVLNQGNERTQTGDALVQSRKRFVDLVRAHRRQRLCPF